MELLFGLTPAPSLPRKEEEPARFKVMFSEQYIIVEFTKYR